MKPLFRKVFGQFTSKPHSFAKKIMAKIPFVETRENSSNKRKVKKNISACDDNDDQSDKINCHFNITNCCYNWSQMSNQYSIIVYRIVFTFRK